MDNLTNNFTYFLSIVTLVSDIFILYFSFILISKNSLPSFLENLLRDHWLKLAFMVSAGAMFGSLYYSEIAGFEPCVLCWYQRIFMMPLFFIFGLALYRKETFIKPYAKLLCITGSLIAIYHYLLQIGVTNIAPCKAILDGASPCAQRPFMEFGYITIPIMSLTAFLLIITIMKFGSEYRKN